MRIAVHDGPFHADDVFAVAVLRMIYPDCSVIRTRDAQLLGGVDLRVDVGLAYNPETGDFDHHQKQGAGQRVNGVPYASFGLIWKHFAHKLCTAPVADLIDSSFVQYIDGPDCGVALDTPRQGFSRYAIPDAIRSFVPPWDSNQPMDEAFFEAVVFGSHMLQREIRQATSRVKGFDKVRDALEHRHQTHIVVLDQMYSWKPIVCEHTQIWYVIAPNAPGKWSVMAVPISPASFTSRKPLPPSWGACQSEQLQHITGVPDAIFCHRQCFVAGAASLQGALALAKKAVEFHGGCLTQRE